MENVQYDGLAAYLGRPSRLHSRPTHMDGWARQNSEARDTVSLGVRLEGERPSKCAHMYHVCITVHRKRDKVVTACAFQGPSSSSSCRHYLVDVVKASHIHAHKLYILAKHTVTSFPSAVPPLSFPSSFIYIGFFDTWMRCGLRKRLLRSRCARLVSPLRFSSMWVVYFELSLECHSEKEGRRRVGGLLNAALLFVFKLMITS